MNLQDSVTFSYKDKSFTVNYPDVGTLIDIENMKSKLAGDIRANSSQQSAYTFILAEMTAHLYHLAPELNDSLGSGSLLNLKVKDANALLKVYMTKVKPWLKEWSKLQGEILEEITLEMEEQSKKNEQK